MISDRPFVRTFERAAAVIGVACLLWFGLDVGYAAVANRSQRQQFELELARGAGTTAVSSVEVAASPVIGLLEIPRLEFSELVLEGDDEDTLQVAIGHLPDTPMPWQKGNSAFAGHRDGKFRPLKDLRRGDAIRLVTKKGTFLYEFTDSVIVAPTDISVLKSGESRMLTLITCYPFSYVGKAPKRFVMSAVAAN